MKVLTKHQVWMTAQEFVSFLDRNIADKPPNFGDGDSVLTLLYEAYNDANNMDNDAIKTGFRVLYEAMNGMPLREMDTIVNPVCALCRDYEQAGFVHDLGNPPFGHSGEKAIQTFFSEGPGQKIKSMVSYESGVGRYGAS